jgi:hypothetical protein
MSSRSRLAEIVTLDPLRDHQRIVYLVSCYEFPWDMTRSLELALFRTFCVPRISALLDRTGEFYVRAQKRYDDTEIIVNELIEYGYESGRGLAALRRMNQQHGRFEIPNEDLLYVLSTFIYEPIRWNARFGWRRMCEQERLGLFYFWREIGRRMGIRDIPADYDEFERFSVEHERMSFRHCGSNHRVGVAVMGLFAGWFPRVVRPVVSAAMRSLMGDPMLVGFGFKKPWALMRWAVVSGLRLRAGALRVLPKRREPRLRTRRRFESYPKGYTIQQVGPPGT